MYFPSMNDSNILPYRISSTISDWPRNLSYFPVKSTSSAIASTALIFFSVPSPRLLYVASDR